MLHAEWKKLRHSAVFRVFFPLLLFAGCLLPRVREPDPLGAVYAAYEGQSAEAVIEDIDRRTEALKLQQELELLSYLPPELAEGHIQSLTEKTGLSVEELEALVVEEPLRFTPDLYSEMELLADMKARAVQSMEYGSYLASIGDQARTIRNSTLYWDNAYALALAEQTARAYDGLPSQALPLADPTGAEAALGGWADDAVSCAIVILAALCLFTQERSSGMLPLLFSTRRGRRDTYRAKMALTALLGVCSCLLFAAARLVWAGDLGDLSRPIQSVPGFYTSPYSLSVGDLLVLSTVQRMLAVPAAGWCMAVLCITLERSLALAAAGLTAAGSILCWTMIDGSSWCQLLKYLSLSAMFSDETLLGNAVFVKFGYHPLPFWAAYAAVVPGGGGLLLLFGRRRFCRSHRALALRVRTNRTPRRKKLPGLFGMELRKLLVKQKAAVLFLVLVLLQWTICDTYRSNFTLDELRYLSEISAVQGPYSAEVHNALALELSELEALQAQSGQLLSDAYSGRIRALQRILTLGDYLSGRAEPVSFVYETGYLALLGRRSIGFSGQQELTLLSLCLMLPGLFTLDPETGMDRLIQTTRETRRLSRRKWAAALMLGAAVFLVCWMPALHFILKTFQISQWSAPAVSLTALSTLPGWISLWLTAAGVWLLRLGEALLWCCGICFTAGKTGRYLTTVLICAALLIMRILLF